MLKALVPDMGLVQLLHLLCRNLAVLRGQGQHLVSGGLYGACLMYIDVGRHSPHRPLMGTQGRCYDRQIGLGSSHQEMDRCIFPSA